jgi:ferredoxin
MRIRVDLDLCQGHEVCCSEASDVFVMEGDKVLVKNVTPSEDRRAAVLAAVKYCPTRAISIEEE